MAQQEQATKMLVVVWWIYHSMEYPTHLLAAYYSLPPFRTFTSRRVLLQWRSETPNQVHSRIHSRVPTGKMPVANPSRVL